MRYGLFSDIHGNLEALEQVLAALVDAHVDVYICMGDVVGYGANPNECADRVRGLNAITVVGNHDHAVIGKLDTAYFNQYARRSAQWTADVLSKENKAFLEALPLVEHFPSFTIVHGSLHAPEMFNYVQTIRDADYNFRMLDKDVLFIGHSHQPLGFFDTQPMTYTLDAVIPIESGVKTIVNVGSVGQPRDEDPRAAYCIYDDETREATIYRVEYDIESAATKIIKAGLPEPLALRLSLGK